MTGRTYRFDPTPARVERRTPVSEPRWDREPVVCAHTVVTGIDRRDGSTARAAVSATPGVVDGVGVVVGSDDGYLRLFDRSLETVYWERRLNRGFYAPVAFRDDGEAFYVSTTGGLVCCLGLKGELVWAQGLEREVYVPPIRLGDHLAVATFDHRLLLLDDETGEPRSELELPAPWGIAANAVAGRRDVYAAPVTTDHGVVICCGEHVVGIAPEGWIDWDVDLDVTVKASPVAIGGGRVAVFGVDGVCRELDTATGRLGRSWALGAKVTASPAVVDDVVVVGLVDGRSVGLDVTSWEPRWIQDGGAPFAYTGYTTLPDGGVVATNLRGNVECRRPETGEFVWETSQVLGRPDHEPELHTTPAVGAYGDLYCSSYLGDLYRFEFRTSAPACTASEGNPT